MILICARRVEQLREYLRVQVIREWDRLFFVRLVKRTKQFGNRSLQVFFHFQIFLEVFLLIIVDVVFFAPILVFGHALIRIEQQFHDFLNQLIEFFLRHESADTCNAVSHRDDLRLNDCGIVFLRSRAEELAEEEANHVLLDFRVVHCGFHESWNAFRCRLTDRVGVLEFAERNDDVRSSFDVWCECFTELFDEYFKHG